ncbi:hypothetical protein [Fluviispira multicolorata]|uniref:Uncharacterized protein n=1 Tax=Fluviispira multicolorata TaxID=2654512 RepID=A0A833JEV6_9BACT|nr:hypothetical protein [Fluviispira multicolorata]KAB8032104.1 hypothetical protein GCL57_05510 [Fluviispira multicolorata]
MRYVDFFLISFFSIISFNIYAVNYNLQIPESSEPVTFTIDEYNQVSFVSLPKNLTGTINLKSNSIGSFYPSGITKESCAQIETKALNAVNTMFPETVRNEQKKFVRKFNIVLIAADSGIHFNLATFRKRILEKAAEIKNIDISNFQLDNSFSIDKINYIIEYDKNAISNIIGLKEEFKPQTDLLLTQTMFTGGSTNFEMSLSDLVCDLYSGKAKIKMNFSGKFGKQSTVSQLLENNEIVNLYQNMLTHNSEYYDNTVYNSRDRNMLLSGLYLKESLQKINLDNIEHKKFIAIFERLISPDNGRIILNMDNNSLYKAMQIQEINSIPYNAKVVYEYQK